MGAIINPRIPRNAECDLKAFFETQKKESADWIEQMSDWRMRYFVDKVLHSMRNLHKQRKKEEEKTKEWMRLHHPNDSMHVAKSDQQRKKLMTVKEPMKEELAQKRHQRPQRVHRRQLHRRQHQVEMGQQEDRRSSTGSDKTWQVSRNEEREKRKKFQKTHESQGEQRIKVKEQWIWSMTPRGRNSADAVTAAKIFEAETNCLSISEK